MTNIARLYSIVSVLTSGAKIERGTTAILGDPGSHLKLSDVMVQTNLLLSNISICPVVWPEFTRVTNVRGVECFMRRLL